MADITIIPSAKVPISEIDTGLVTTQWYRYLFNLYTITSGGTGGVLAVTATSPIISSGGISPNISMPAATTSNAGYLTASDWNTFFNKAGSGANSDITSLSGLTGGISTPDYITFDTTPETVPTATGSLYWDSADGIQTLNLVMAGGNAVQQIGEETYYRIKASSAITEGQVVMFTGTVGASGALQGAPATGLTASTASYVMGIATENIALNGWGYVTAFGLVRGIDTSMFSDGDILYYDPTVAGGLTATLPSAPNAKVQVCAVIYAAGNGSLFVRPSFGGVLGQYEGNVQITSVADNDLLQYYAAGGYWRNVAASTISGVTSVTATTPLASSGGATPNLTIAQATTSTSGYLSSTDWNTFNNKGSGTVTSVGGTGTVNGLTLTGTVTSSGNLTLGGTLSGIDLATQVTGNLPVTNLNSGTGASSTTFWRGDGTWAAVTASVTPAQVSDQSNTSTGYFDLPVGTTAQRPGSPNTGMIRYNSTTSAYEVYDGSAWVQISTAQYTYAASYLSVAGGGGAGTYGGGGGAGGMLTGSTSLIVGTTYTIVVGAGGAGGSAGSGRQGVSGSNTTFTGLTTTIGGGGGGDAWNGYTALNGGSGGGTAGYGNGTGTAGQGNNGGTAAYAGGGGAGAVGGNGSAGSYAGAGGVGSASSITGSSVTYAGGGGGSDYNGGGAAGGSGGGGNGAGLANGGNGTANLGGGGGSCGQAYLAGSGGSGVFILSVPTASYSGVTTGSPTITTSGGNTIIKFTTSGSYTA